MLDLPVFYLKTESSTNLLDNFFQRAILLKIQKELTGATPLTGWVNRSQAPFQGIWVEERDEHERI